MALFYDPTFQLLAPVPTLGVAGPAPSQRDLTTLGFSPLPGTAREGQLLIELAQSSGYQVDAVGQAAASEAHLKHLDSPRILHLATHGFFLPEEKEAVQLANPCCAAGWL